MRSSLANGPGLLCLPRLTGDGAEMISRIRVNRALNHAEPSIGKGEEEEVEGSGRLGGVERRSMGRERAERETNVSTRASQHGSPIMAGVRNTDEGGGPHDSPLPLGDPKHHERWSKGEPPTHGTPPQPAVVPLWRIALGSIEARAQKSYLSGTQLRELAAKSDEQNRRRDLTTLCVIP